MCCEKVGSNCLKVGFNFAWADENTKTSRSDERSSIWKCSAVERSGALDRCIQGSVRRSIDGLPGPLKQLLKMSMPTHCSCSSGFRHGSLDTPRMSPSLGTPKSLTPVDLILSHGIDASESTHGCWDSKSRLHSSWISKCQSPSSPLWVAGLDAEPDSVCRCLSKRGAFWAP